MIITRYLTKEVLNTVIALTFILLLIFLSQQLIRYLNYVASGKIAAHLLFKLLALQIPALLAFLLPLGLFLGVILTYGQLYSNNELRVLHACGFNPLRLLSITSLLASGVVLIVMVLTLWINPAILAKKEYLLASSGGRENVLDTIMPGRFQVSNDGQRVVYVEKLSRNRKRAENIFIAEEKPLKNDATTNTWVVLSADQGYQTQDILTKQRFVVATDGYRYEGVPGQNDYRIIQFKQYAVQIPDVMTINKDTAQNAMPTRLLFKNDHLPQNAAELHWRFAIPISSFLLALMAVRLSRVRPRQGRYSVLLPAVLIYIVYMNLLFIGRNFIEQGTVSIFVGLWWVHALALLFLVILLRMRSAG